MAAAVAPSRSCSQSSLEDADDLAVLLQEMDAGSAQGSKAKRTVSNSGTIRLVCGVEGGGRVGGGGGPGPEGAETALSRRSRRDSAPIRLSMVVVPPHMTRHSRFSVESGTAELGGDGRQGRATEVAVAESALLSSAGAAGTAAIVGGWLSNGFAH